MALGGRFQEPKIIHLLLSHVQRNQDILVQTNDVLHDQIMSLVEINMTRTDAVTVTVKLLSIVAHTRNEIPIAFFYSIIPYSTDKVHANNILAKSVVAIMLQNGNSYSVRVSNFSCLLCGSDVYDASTQSCQCRPGTVPVCLPCTTDCNAGTFIVNPDSSRCATGRLKHTEEAGIASFQRHNLMCLPCSGSMFCRDGTVTGVKTCPTDRPFVLEKYAVGDFECVCAPSFAPRRIMSFDYNLAESRKNSGLSRMPRVLNESENGSCVLCSVHQLCSPDDTRHDYVTTCPMNTRSSIDYLSGDNTSMISGSVNAQANESQYNHVHLACLCQAGFYMTKTHRKQYLTDATDLLYQYEWDHALLQEKSKIGNTKIHTRIETCRMCEVGWKCSNSERTKCETSATSLAGSSSCSCLAGYLKGPDSCLSCPLNSVCYGGNAAAVPCSRPRTGRIEDNYCPCPPGQILNAATWRCEECPPHFYCAGFTNMTGVEPSQTTFARKCPYGATSALSSVDILNCSCAEGYFFEALVAKNCLACGSGYYCTKNMPRRVCPPATSTVSSLSTSVQDCICSAENTQLSRSNFTEQTCVCRAGWLQKRCV